MAKRSGKSKRKQSGRTRVQAKRPAQINQAQNDLLQNGSAQDNKNIIQDNTAQNNTIRSHRKFRGGNDGNGQEDMREGATGKKKGWTRGDVIAVIAIVVMVVVAVPGIIVAVCDIVGDNRQQGGDTNYIANYNAFYAGQPVDLSYSDARYRAGQELFEDGKYDKALEMFDEAEREYKSQSAADVNLVRIQYAVGMTYKYKGDYEAAIDNYTIAIGTLESLEKNDAKPEADNTKAGEPDATETEESDALEYELGYVHYLRGTAYVDSHQLEKGAIDLNACADAVGYFEKGTGAEKWYDLSSVYNAFGELFFASAYSEHSPYDTGEVLGYTYQDAYEAYNAALGLKGLRKTYDDDGDKILTYLGNQIEIFDQLGTYSMPERDEDGKVNFWELLDVLERGWYEIYFIDAEAADILLNRANVASCMGYYDAALYDCETALKIYEAIGPSVRSKVADAYFTISNIMLEQSAMGDGVPTDKAKKQFVDYMTKGVQYNEKWLGRGFDTARLYENQGFAYLLDDQWDKATNSFATAKRIFADLELPKEVEKEEKYIEMASELKAEGEGGEWIMERIESSH